MISDFRIAGGLRSLSIYTDGLESLGSLLIYAGSTLSIVAAARAATQAPLLVSSLKLSTIAAACVAAQALPLLVSPPELSTFDAA